jgi:hypothetical protein
MDRPLAHRGQGIEPLHRGAHGPFPDGAAEVLAAWADRRIDISAEAVYIGEAEAVRAIHDAHYATPPRDFFAYRHRLQYIAEMTVGARQRQSVREEDAAVARAQEAASG